MSRDLQRFVDAQGGSIEGVLGELRAGRKTGHWIWFVFPQLAGLGRSELSRFYALRSVEEAAAYLAHPVLGPRLLAATDALLSSGRGAAAVLGPVDARKVCSSMTLFHRAAPDEPRFRRVLDRLYEGRADPLTDALLEDGPPPDDRVADTETGGAS